MSNKTASCILCPSKQLVTAEQQQWLIHIAKHREDLIKFFSENFQYCFLCKYTRIFENKRDAASHLRWEHSKKSLIDWFYKNILLKDRLCVTI